MPELATILLTALVTFATQYAKKHPLIGGSPKILAAGIAVGIGICYAVFQVFVPVDMQQSLIAFCATIWAGSIAVYEVIKPFLKKK